MGENCPGKMLPALQDSSDINRLISPVSHARTLRSIASTCALCQPILQPIRIPDRPAVR